MAVRLQPGVSVSAREMLLVFRICSDCGRTLELQPGGGNAESSWYLRCYCGMSWPLEVEGGGD